MLHAITDAMAAREAVARRAAGARVVERPAKIYADSEHGVTVWYLDDGALALYRVAGGRREPEAHAALPGARRLLQALDGTL